MSIHLLHQQILPLELDSTCWKAMAAKTKNLPQELVDMVIDHLHDQFTELMTCSLVCRSWITPSRYHLFATLSLASGHDFKKWSQRFLPSSSTPAAPASFVKTLWVRSPAADLASFMEHFRSFPRVQQLRISWLDLDVFRNKAPSVCFCHFAATLRSLCLSWPITYVPADFLGFICAFQYLDDLSIEGLHIGGYDISQFQMPVSSPSFSGCLTLDKCDDPGQIIGHLAAFPGGIHFRHMVFKDAKFTQSEHFASTFSHCTSTLERITIIDAAFLNPTHNGGHLLSLEGNNVLQEVVLSVSEDKVGWVKHLLATITSPHLCRVVFNLTPTLGDEEPEADPEVEDEDDEDDDEWEKIDHALVGLSNERPQLKVVIAISGGWAKENAMVLGEELLPNVNKRKALQVSV